MTARLLTRLTPALLAALVLSGCGSASAPSADPAPSSAAGSALGDDVSFYVDPDSNAHRAARSLRSSGKPQQARRLEQRIASRPTAVWVTGAADQVYAQTRRITEAAAARDTVPVLVAYNLPGRDCGQFSSGGAAGIDDYLDWLGSMAAGIGRHEAVVVLEPDAVAHSLDGCNARQSTAERYRLLTEAVKILERQPGAKVYLDAGNASWVRDLGALASALRASGVQRADGFALNVSNFETTEASARYGEQLSRRLDGARFVIDTSRNGAGPPPRPSDSAARPTWCNPAGRRLGTPPTTDTDLPLVDALLWVKQPGDSDGPCGHGDPAAGHWFPGAATGLMNGAAPTAD